MKAKRKNKGFTGLKSSVVDPSSLPQPDNASGYVSRAMSYYARKNYEKAVDDFNKAIALDPASEDAYYGLGMTLKAAGKKDESIHAFESVIRIIMGGQEKTHNRIVMLRRLALGHINEMNSGDWNLEKEIWKHIA